MTSPSMPRTRTHQVTGVDALEILDSRGRPTLQVTVAFGNGTTATARLPPEASTGSGEAVERRDGDKTRYQGRVSPARWTPCAAGSPAGCAGRSGTTWRRLTPR